MSLDRAGEPHRSQRDDAGEQYHDYAQAVDPRGEAHPPIWRDAKRCDVLEVGMPLVEGRKQKQRRCKRQNRRSERNLPCGRANHDQDGRNDGTENREQNHQRITAK